MSIVSIMMHYEPSNFKLPLLLAQKATLAEGQNAGNRRDKKEVSLKWF